MEGPRGATRADWGRYRGASPPEKFRVFAAQNGSFAAEKEYFGVFDRQFTKTQQGISSTFGLKMINLGIYRKFTETHQGIFCKLSVNF